MSEKIYCGNGKKGQYSVKMNICLDDVPAEWIKTGKNGKRYIRLELNERKNIDQYGNTHGVSVDTWVKSEPKTESNIFPDDWMPL